MSGGDSFDSIDGRTYSGEAPGQAARTPGQAAYEDWQDAMVHSAPQVVEIPWPFLAPDAQAWWERQAAQDAPEGAYEQWIKQRDPADVGSRAGFTAGWQAASAAQERPAPGDDASLSEHVTVRFPADMSTAVKHLAAAEGMTASAWIRREVEREAERRERPAPELAEQLRAAIGRTLILEAERDQVGAELDRIKQQYAAWLGRYASNGSGWNDRVSGTVLARAYRDANLPVRDDLSHLAGP